MIGYVVLAAALNGVLTHIFMPFAWIILGRWMHGRELIVASVAASIAFGLGKTAYAGPPAVEAAAVLVGLASTLLSGALIARLWLARFDRQQANNG